MREVLVSVLVLVGMMMGAMGDDSQKRDELQYTPPLDLDTLKMYLIYAYSAFCSDGTLGNWTCFWCSKQANMTDVPPLIVTQIVDPDGLTGIYGYVGYSKTQSMKTS